MTIEALMKAVPPPGTPYEAYEGPWDSVERRLRTPLPQDYKDFVRLYGCGYFMQFLEVNVPKSRNPDVQLEHRAYVARRRLRHLFRDDFADALPYALWPEAGGLLLWGSSHDGDDFFWLMSGAPADWPVVVLESCQLRFQKYDCGLTGFLAGLATGAIDDFELDTFERVFAPGTGPPPSDAAFSVSWTLGGFGSLRGASKIKLR